jgi:hypothetical protein
MMMSCDGGLTDNTIIRSQAETLYLLGLKKRNPQRNKRAAEKNEIESKFLSF